MNKLSLNIKILKYGTTRHIRVKDFMYYEDLKKLVEETKDKILNDCIKNPRKYLGKYYKK